MGFSGFLTNTAIRLETQRMRKKNTVKKGAVILTGTVAGAATGAKAGAEAGAFLGVACTCGLGGPGAAAAGAAVGGTVLGIAGGIGGYATSKRAADGISDDEDPWSKPVGRVR